MLLQDTRDEALKEGKKEGRKEGIEESNLRSVKNIMEELHFSPEQAMNVLKLSQEEREFCRKALRPAALGSTSGVSFGETE